MARRVMARAPASVANLGCLFDAVAMAVDAFYDEVTVEEKESGGIEVEAVGPVPSGKLNVAYAAVAHFARKVYGREVGLKITVKKGVPVGSGLGSSGATAAAAVAAANELLGIGAQLADLLEAAGAGEALAAGSPHYDNVAASLLGGIVLLDPLNPRVNIVLEPPSWLRVVLFVRESPGTAKTRFMREVLPEAVSLKEASRWAFSAAAFAVGIARGVKACLSFASEGGPVEKARARYIPGYWECKAAALRAGALAFNISGAGPSLFALADEETAESVAQAVAKIAAGYKPVVARVAVAGALRSIESKK